MDLNLFLEKDIIEFLEKEENKRRNRMEEVEDEEFDFFNIQKDYYKRLIRALDQNDVEKAKEIFDDVKKKHEEAKNELEKKQLYTLLDDIYMEIKKHTDKTKNDAELEQEVESIEKDGVITKESDKQEQKKEQEKIKNEIAESSVKINSYLRKEDLQAAMIEYKTMKSKFNKLDGTEEEKEDVFQDVMAAYYQIKRLEKHVQEKKLTREQKKKIDKEETAKKVKKEI
ncbi:MAG: hypothetical protein KKC26_01160, partial [Nanoarchaeota archaeon]|nr:hypothetical protein [Nanoarchaeota archaeon]MBU1849330.1 hypothetical protein [Nanoarchaeota archaeon]